jgi:hypothetical protein
VPVGQQSTFALSTPEGQKNIYKRVIRKIRRSSVTIGRTTVKKQIITEFRRSLARTWEIIFMSPKIHCMQITSSVTDFDSSVLKHCINQKLQFQISSTVKKRTI